MKQFLTASTMGLCGALATLIAFSFQLPSWVLFMAWVSYYLFGKSFRSALYTIIPITSGIIMGIMIKLLGGGLNQYLGILGFPLAVFILITSLTYMSKIKGLHNIPAWFMGLIIFFGVHPNIEIKPIMLIFISITLGFIFAFLNDTITIFIKKNKV
ncbi:DUF1097 domain-containing protein [uncultured Formosa sp.]|uniref:DUF1097 domain-containing protein n=1 Tax=uncultured Formosa sp. TaxID=255435 RepID=UPI0026272A1E|nr:DUF1097 domain-containing protein [uncultured Formosa sp.]